MRPRLRNQSAATRGPREERMHKPTGDLAAGGLHTCPGDGGGGDSTTWWGSRRGTTTHPGARSCRPPPEEGLGEWRRSDCSDVAAAAEELPKDPFPCRTKGWWSRSRSGPRRTRLSRASA
ncbi:hypothetical protein Mapa_011936 [Marchantia paleacea]|nr:hypothetical protein Mapa_011936 [Marchantia paleacea]